MINMYHTERNAATLDDGGTEHKWDLYSGTCWYL